ncbi:DUF2383 domain-containing protein [Sporosalibacterium faouarense]|uniref:DUF2383 domain-containing protein n=1 Tax=Sporosalibacterium faouarense TaxID=516123 RepID=UPI00141C802F|nr:DUF2383 domain-containing protein [Sporosalibacterium faouarense]MTI47314.1 DUF2383 domain-containing protein [Bacillota bacterium]
MNSGENNLKTLNTLLQGEQMGVDSFNLLISKVKDTRLRNTFQKMQKDHRDHSAQLSKRIQDLGGTPHEKLGLKGVMADTMLNFDLKMDDTDKHILDKAYKGVSKGVSMSEEIARGDLDSESMNLVKDILSKDKSHIEIMESLKSEFSSEELS